MARSAGDRAAWRRLRPLPTCAVVVMRFPWPDRSGGEDRMMDGRSEDAPRDSVSLIYYVDAARSVGSPTEKAVSSWKTNLKRQTRLFDVLGGRRAAVGRNTCLCLEHDIKLNIRGPWDSREALACASPNRPM